MPWSYITSKEGVISVRDTAGKDVPLMFMLDLICTLTIDLARPTGRPSESKQ